MLALISLTLLAVSVSATAVEGDECKGDIQMIACMFLVDADKISGNKLEETEESLNKRCDESQPILKCLSDWAVKCPGDILKNLKAFFIDEYSTLKKVCDKNGSLRKKYLENAKCLNKYKRQTESKCGKVFEFKEADTLSKEHCASYAETFQCTYKDVESTCGKDAHDLETELWIPVTTLMDHVCSDFQFSVLRYMPQIWRSYQHLV